MSLDSHLDRPVRVEVRDGREVVVKRYLRAGSEHVFEDMLVLWLSPFGRERRSPGMPEPLSVDLGTAEVVMTHVPGFPLCRRGDTGDLAPWLPQVGALLADLHSSGVVLQHFRSAHRVVESSRRKVSDLRARSEAPRAVDGAAAVAAAAHEVVELLGASLPVAEDLTPCHGDFSPLNVLGDPTGVVLIDMDRMQMADPAHDLAYWGAWLWATEAMNDLAPTWVGLNELIKAYTRCRGKRFRPDPATLAFHQAAALVRIVHSWSALQLQPAVQCLLLAEAERLLGGRP
jgi:Ser/Thr protein kinase RdoA (MazF antagonist)